MAAADPILDDIHLARSDRVDVVHSAGCRGIQSVVADHHLRAIVARDRRPYRCAAAGAEIVDDDARTRQLEEVDIRRRAAVDIYADIEAGDDAIPDNDARVRRQGLHCVVDVDRLPGGILRSVRACHLEAGNRHRALAVQRVIVRACRDRRASVADDLRARRNVDLRGRLDRALRDVQPAIAGVQRLLKVVGVISHAVERNASAAQYPTRACTPRPYPILNPLTAFSANAFSASTSFCTSPFGICT